MVSSSPVKRSNLDFKNFFQSKKDKTTGNKTFAASAFSRNVRVKESFAYQLRKIADAVPQRKENVFGGSVRINDQLKEVNENLLSINSSIKDITNILVEQRRQDLKNIKEKRRKYKRLAGKMQAERKENVLEGNGKGFVNALKKPFSAINRALGNPLDKIKNALLMLGIGWLTDKFIKLFQADRDGEKERFDELVGEISKGLLAMGGIALALGGGLTALIATIGGLATKVGFWIASRPFVWLYRLGKFVFNRLRNLNRTPSQPRNPGSGNLPTSRNPGGLNRGVTRSGGSRNPLSRNPLRARPTVTQGRGGTTFRQRLGQNFRGFTKTGRGVSTGTPTAGRSGGGGGAGWAMLALMAAELLEPFVVDQIATAKFSNLSDLEVLQKIENLTIQLDRTAKEDEKRQAELKAAGGYYSPIDKRYYKNYSEFLAQSAFGSFLPDDETVKTKDRLTDLNALFKVGQTKGLFNKVTVNNEDTFQLTEKGGNVEFPAPLTPLEQTLELHHAANEWQKILKTKPKGGGETVRFPGVGTIVNGRNLFGVPEVKYFGLSGTRITKDEFESLWTTNARRLNKLRRQFLEEENNRQNQGQTQTQVEPTEAEISVVPPQVEPTEAEISVVPPQVEPTEAEISVVPRSETNTVAAVTPAAPAASQRRSDAVNQSGFTEGQQVTVDVAQVTAAGQKQTSNNGQTASAPPALSSRDLSNPYRLLARSIYNVVVA